MSEMARWFDGPMMRSPDDPILVLASASPRRQELLRNARMDFVVRPADLDEDRLPDEPPQEYVQRLARDKARAVWNAIRNSGAPEIPAGKKVFVLGADTTVVVNDDVLEKPRDAADAARMLRLLSGRTHRVLTGVCLLGEGVEDVRCAVTEVAFEPLSDDDIAAYIATGEPMDKAGAYAIQGVASRWVRRLDGDYFNVVGLPVGMVWRMWKDVAR